MIDEIFEVTKKDYETLLAELKSEYYDKEVHNADDHFEVYFYSKDHTRTFAACIGDASQVKYYIVDLPQPHERGATPIIRQILLQDEESVKEFFQVLNESRQK